MIYLFRLALIFFLLLIAGADLMGQQRQYLFSNISIRDGLQEERVISVQQDAKGFIWIASHSALQRYDGKRFLNFYPNAHDPAAIPTGGINGMLIDKKNRLWLLTGSAVLGYIDLATFVYQSISIKYPSVDFDKSKPVLHLDKDGNVIVIFVSAGFLTYSDINNEVSRKNNPFQLPAGWQPLYMWQDDARNYWIGANKGLLKYSATKKLFSSGENNAEQDPFIDKLRDTKTVVFAFKDKTNRLWIIAWPQNRMIIKSYSASTGEEREWQQSILKPLKGVYYEMHGITELSDGSLWMAGYNILASINPATQQIEPVLSNSAAEYSIRYDEVFSIFEDKEKNVWVSTDKGLFRFNPSAQLFQAIKLSRPGSDSIHSPDINDVLQTPEGDILVSTWGEGVFTFDKNFNAKRSPHEKIFPGTEMTWCLTKRKNGDIWRGVQNGNIVIYEAATRKLTRLHPDVFGNSTVRQISEDKNGNLWIGTQRGDLVKWDPLSRKFILLQQFKAIVARILIDSANDVWVCTDQKGVYQVNSNDGSVKSRYGNDGPQGKRLKINGAADIIQYNDSLFVLAGDGLNVLNTRDGTIRFFTTENGLPSGNISNLIKDQYGYIWMSTSAGIVSYHPFRKKLSTYNASDGVHTNSFNVASSVQLSDGRIAFGTNHDLLVFDPAKVTVIDYVPPKVAIAGFALMNKPLKVDSLEALPRIMLRDFEHSITIQLSTLTHQNTYNIFYMMEGMDRQWVDAGKATEANFNYMPPGKYTFKTACRDGAGNLGQITALSIYIKPPFYLTWWFLCLLAFAGIVVLYWFDKFRVGRIRETERVRTRIATSLTKDMSTTLGNINLLSEMAKLKVDKDIDRTKDYISQISNNSNRMMEVMDDMIWSINPENDELQYTITRMRKYAADIQSKYNMEIGFNVDKKARELKLHMDRRHELFLIYKEALLNAGMHGKSRFAEVSMLYEKSKLKMKISDDGNGFDTEEVSFGRGLNEMRKRASLLKADLDIISGLNNGTTVVLEMKV